MSVRKAIKIVNISNLTNAYLFINVRVMTNAKNKINHVNAGILVQKV